MSIKSRFRGPVSGVVVAITLVGSMPAVAVDSVGVGRVVGCTFPGHGIGNDFAGYGLGGMHRDSMRGGLPRDHLHHTENIETAFGYYDGFSYGDECYLLDNEFRYRRHACE